MQFAHSLQIYVSLGVNGMKKSDFYYNLPEELIAQTPVEPRNSSRLLALGKLQARLPIKDSTIFPNFLTEMVSIG